ncbi:hypothetical protein C2G38_1025752 [Gigaspora rosea]|uniref:Uncharacterized protein n=1 Tax=Gigaspora rosea TaxID=44941 RepID=A0A397VJY9_9GLOM|nr:hypothetical protein C2G38_1025752 [Gigaspora rosea]
MKSLLTATAEKVNSIFIKLMTYENVIDWIQFYQKPYIIASLNPNISKISNNDWYAAPNSTNCAEAAHSLSNREGKQLKLMTAILRGQKLDMRYFKRIEIKKKTIILILLDMIKVVSSEKFQLSNEALTDNRKLVPQQKKHSIRTSKNKKPQRSTESSLAKNDFVSDT